MIPVLAQLSAAGVNTYFVPKDFSEPGYWIDYAELDGVMLAHLSKARTGFIYNPAKRLLDVVTAVIIAGIACAAAVRHCGTGEIRPRPGRFCFARIGSVKMAACSPCISSGRCSAMRLATTIRRRTAMTPISPPLAACFGKPASTSCHRS